MAAGPGLPGPAGFAALPVEYIKDTQRSVFLNSDLGEPQYLFLVTLYLQHVGGSSLIIFILLWDDEF